LLVWLARPVQVFWHLFLADRGQGLRDSGGEEIGFVGMPDQWWADL
jgi:hypothetical protein